MKNKNIQINKNNNGLIQADAPCDAALRGCEEVIQHGFSTFIEVGAALLRIRDEQLYRLAHRNFGEYCRQRWNFGKAHANRLGAASQVSRELAPIGAISHESQLRPLLRLEANQRREAWIEALKISPNPTQLQVRAAARKVTGEPRVARLGKMAANGPSVVPMFHFSERFRAFCELGIREARSLIDLSASCDLRDALMQAKCDLENCQRLLDERERKHG